MENFLNYNLSLYNKLIEVQIAVNAELMNIGKILQTIFSKDANSMSDMKQVQDQIMKHSDKITKLLTDANENVLSEANKFSAKNIDDSTNMYKSLLAEFIKSSKSSQEQYLKMFNSVLEQFNKTSK